jgi:hypothetical protein
MIKQRCFHDCEINPGTCAQCQDFKETVGSAAMQSGASSADAMGQAIFDALFDPTLPTRKGCKP